MSPRHNRPPRAVRRGQPAGTAGHGVERTDSWRGEEWVVRAVPGASALKHYRCPGCDQFIPPGMPHLVTWPQLGAVDDRRHWHNPCWTARDRRTPTRTAPSRVRWRSSG